MANVQAARSWGGSHKELQEKYNYLLDVLATRVTVGRLESRDKSTFIDFNTGTFQFKKDNNNLFEYNGTNFVFKGPVTITGDSTITGSLEVNATISGTAVKLVINPSKGLAFYQGTTYRGGLEIVNGNVSLATDLIKAVDVPGAYVKQVLTDYSGFKRAEAIHYTPSGGTGTGSAFEFMRTRGYADVNAVISDIVGRVQGSRTTLTRLLAVNSLSDESKAYSSVVASANSTGNIYGVQLYAINNAGTAYGELYITPSESYMRNGNNWLGVDSGGPYYIKSGTKTYL